MKIYRMQLVEFIGWIHCISMCSEEKYYTRSNSLIFFKWICSPYNTTGVPNRFSLFRHDNNFFYIAKIRQDIFSVQSASIVFFFFSFLDRLVHWFYDSSSCSQRFVPIPKICFFFFLVFISFSFNSRWNSSFEIIQSLSLYIFNSTKTSINSWIKWCQWNNDCWSWLWITHCTTLRKIFPRKFSVSIDWRFWYIGFCHSQGKERVNVTCWLVWHCFHFF